MHGYMNVENFYCGTIQYRSDMHIKLRLSSKHDGVLN